VWTMWTILCRARQWTASIGTTVSSAALSDRSVARSIRRGETVPPHVSAIVTDVRSPSDVHAPFSL
jgi:hypothetical protein